MYIEDLSPYYYCGLGPFPKTYPVGWLDGKHDYSKGAMSPELVKKLEIMMLGNDAVKIQFDKIRGIEGCNICGAYDAFFRSKLQIGSTTLLIDNEKGDIFVSPSLIYHHITEHDYCPPTEYQEAIANFDMQRKFDAHKKFHSRASELPDNRA